MGEYRNIIEFRMSGTADPVDEAVARQLKRGWCIGGESFRGWLGVDLDNKHLGRLLKAAGLVYKRGSKGYQYVKE